MAERKSIAFFGIKFFPSRGGTSRVAENLIVHLADEYDITIYCYKNDLAKKHIDGVNVIEFPEIKLGSFGVFLFYFLCYCHIRIKGDYDVVHAHKIDSFIFIKGLQKQTKVIATVHGTPYKDSARGKLARIFFKYSEKRFLKFQGIRTAISKPLSEHYQAKYNVDVRYIPNGIDLTTNETDDTIAHFWPEKLPHDTPFVFFAARRIMGTKGLHTMLKAYKKIDFQGHIFVAGELDFDPAYMKQVKPLGEGLNVHYLGYVSPLPYLLKFVKKCEYFVFPSEIEGMSIMLLEVASTGKPILASDIPENKQVFNQDEVLFFKSKNVADLSDKLKWISKNTSSFEAMGQQAKAKVVTTYTWDRIVHEYKKLYGD